MGVDTVSPGNRFCGITRFGSPSENSSSRTYPFSMWYLCQTLGVPGLHHNAPGIFRLI